MTGRRLPQAGVTLYRRLDRGLPPQDAPLAIALFKLDHVAAGVSFLVKAESVNVSAFLARVHAALIQPPLPIASRLVIDCPRLGALGLGGLTMLVERTDLTIDEARAPAFDVAMADRGVPLLKAVPGVLAVNFGRGVEHPTKFMLLVTWETMEAHKAYNATAACTELRQLIGSFAPTSAAMEHFELN